MSSHLESAEHPLNFIDPRHKNEFHMTREDLRSVWLDYHLADRFAGELPSQKAIVKNSAENGLPEMQVGPFEGHLMMTMLSMIGAKRGVEIGTLGGYSASWFCRAIEGQPGAHLDSLELNPAFAEVAKKNLEPWSKLFTIHVGSAVDTLKSKLSDAKDLDFVFIDAVKASYPLFFDWAWPRIRKGGIILLDNFYLWGGIYFGADANPPPKEFTEGRRERSAFSPTQLASMKGLWQRLQDLGEAAHKTILPTSEGLGLVVKR